MAANSWCVTGARRWLKKSLSFPTKLKPIRLLNFVLGWKKYIEPRCRRSSTPTTTRCWIWPNPGAMVCGWCSWGHFVNSTKKLVAFSKMIACSAFLVFNRCMPGWRLTRRCRCTQSLLIWTPLRVCIFPKAACMPWPQVWQQRWKRRVYAFSTARRCRAFCDQAARAVM